MPPVVVLCILFSPTGARSFFPEKKLTARAAFVMNAATGQVLYERRPDLPLPPASTTKVVTAIVALEHARLEKRLRVTRNAARVPSLKIGLRPGQAMSVRDLLASALLYSANDAAVVLAEGIGGSVTSFARMMTAKAHQVKAVNSTFKNPHGLTAPGHISTARDLALLFNYAIKKPEFRTIVRTKRTSVSLITGGRHRRVRRIPLRNKNRLLWSLNGAIGGKTGYTRAARRCFVGAASRRGVPLIVSVLGSRSLWPDVKRLFEYGFRKFGIRGGPLNGYVVQIASFHDQDRAESLRTRIEKEGYPASVETALLNNGRTIHRVRVGPYPKESQARAAAHDLESRNGLKSIVLSVPPVDRIGRGGGSLR